MKRRTKFAIGIFISILLLILFLFFGTSVVNAMPFGDEDQGRSSSPVVNNIESRNELIPVNTNQPLELNNGSVPVGNENLISHPFEHNGSVPVGNENLISHPFYPGNAPVEEPVNENVSNDDQGVSQPDMYHQNDSTFGW